MKVYTFFSLVTLKPSLYQSYPDPREDPKSRSLIGGGSYKVLALATASSYDFRCNLEQGLFILSPAR